LFNRFIAAMSAHRLSLELALCSQKTSKTILIFLAVQKLLRRLDRLPDSFCTFTTLLTRANQPQEIKRATFVGDSGSSSLFEKAKGRQYFKDGCISYAAMVMTCVYRQLKRGRSGDEVRPGWRAN
jgi:hypothetical protein